MKKGIDTFLIAALVVLVVYLSYTYLDKSLGQGSEVEGNYTITPGDTDEAAARESETKTDTCDDEMIRKIVDAYQKGYQEGCRQESKSVPTEEKGEAFKRSYNLGYDKGQKFCTAKRKRQKELSEKGKKEGCQSASGSHLRDETLYTQNEHYKKAWDNGYQKCRKSGAVQKAQSEEKPGRIPEKPKPEQTAEKNINPNSEAYRKGYRQGCDVSRGGYQKRDEWSYLHSQEYRAGWTKGRSECKVETEKSVPESTRPEPTQRELAQRHFDQGYEDGCDSARGYFRRDRTLYVRYPSYREGWQRGEYECRSRPLVPPPPPMPLDPFGF